VVVRTPIRPNSNPPAGRSHRRGPLVFDDRADSKVGPVLIVDFGIGERTLLPKPFWTAARATQAVRDNMNIDSGVR
jgi:hypothetical protein